MLVLRWNVRQLGFWVAVVCATTGCSSSRQQTRSFAVDHSAPVVQPQSQWADSREHASDDTGSRASTAGHAPHSGGESGNPPRILREAILEGRASGTIETPSVVQTNGEGAPLDGQPALSAAPIGNPLVANLLAEDHRLRLTTIEVIEEAARDGYAFSEEVPDANGVTVIVTLRWLAYGYNAKGTWVESSLDVRRRAMAAIAVVDPNNHEFNKPYCVDPNSVDITVISPETGLAPDQGVITTQADGSTTPASPIQEMPELPATEVAVIDVMQLPDSPADVSPSTEPVPAPVAPVDVVAPVDKLATEFTPASPDVVNDAPIAADSSSATSPALIEEGPTDTDSPEMTLEESSAPKIPEESATSDATPPESDTEQPASPTNPVRDIPAPTPVRSAEPVIEQPLVPVPPQTAPPETAPPRDESVQVVRPTSPPLVEAAPVVALKGVIVSVEPRLGTAWIKLEGARGIPPAGQRLVVIHRYPLGRLSSMGEVEVVRSTATHAEVRVIAGTPISKVAVGDQVNSSAR